MSMAQLGCIDGAQHYHNMWATLSRPFFDLGRDLTPEINNAPYPTQLTQHTNKLTHNMAPCPPNANDTHTSYAGGDQSTFGMYGSMPLTSHPPTPRTHQGYDVKAITIMQGPWSAGHWDKQ